MRPLRSLLAVLLTLGIASCQIFLAGEPPEVDIGAFGVRGDGVADDGPGLQAAIDAAESRGEPLDIPTPRNFYASFQTLVVTSATVRGSGAEIRNPNGTVLRVLGPARVSGLTLTGRNGIELHGGTLENLTVTGTGGGYPGDGWAIYGLATTFGDAVIRGSILRGQGIGTFAVGLLDSTQLTLEDDSVVGVQWGVYVRGRSTLTATRTSIFGAIAGLELDRKPAGYPVWDGIDRFGDTDIVLTDCAITTDPGGPRWDMAVPFIAGVGHVVLAGTTNPASIWNNYSGPDGDPPVGPPIGSVNDIIVRR